MTDNVGTQVENAASRLVDIKQQIDARTQQGAVMNPGVLDYTGEAVVDVRSAGIPGVVELTIHTPATSASALMDSYALRELRAIIRNAFERTQDK